MLKAEFVLQSRELTLAEITATMGRQSDAGYDRGSFGPVRRAPREWTSWSVELEWPGGMHGGTEGLANAIESLGLALAERAAELSSWACDVVVSVHQELADTPESAGLHLTPEAIRWMAVAGASIDVDQYAGDGSKTPSPD